MGEQSFDQGPFCGSTIYLLNLLKFNAPIYESFFARDQSLGYISFIPFFHVKYPPVGTRMRKACISKRRCNIISPRWLNGHQPNESHCVGNIIVCFKSYEHWNVLSYHGGWEGINKNYIYHEKYYTKILIKKTTATTKKNQTKQNTHKLLKIQMLPAHRDMAGKQALFDIIELHNKRYHLVLFP